MILGKNRILKKQSTFCCYIDMRKAFDSVNRTCLQYKLLKAGLKGKMSNAVNSLYQNYKCTIRLNNDVCTDYFEIPNGLKQGCVLSPTLFKLFINDMATDVNSLNLGVKLDDFRVSMLMFADDIVLIAPSEGNLQQMMNEVDLWCRKWRLSLNDTKTQIVQNPNSLAAVIS